MTREREREKEKYRQRVVINIKGASFISNHKWFIDNSHINIMINNNME